MPMPGRASKDPIHRLCTVSIHEGSSSDEGVLLNLEYFPHERVKDGDLMRISLEKEDFEPKIARNGAVSASTFNQLGNSNVEESRYAERNSDSIRTHLFVAKAASAEMLTRQPTIQLSLSQHAASAFYLSKGNCVLVSTVEELACRASHVEIVFRDQYLARADMWRLVNSELVNTCVYTGQKIVFMATIKATVKAIFIQGKKAQSALFHTSTKPIFRSESARYVLFIQMSKEMWDFDAEGTGEIMFDKVVNGFLPELFKRWQKMQVRHLVSIVLFTRMMYDEAVAPILAGSQEETNRALARDRRDCPAWQDFYRVVVSDMASGEWTEILNQLKREFKVFLRDISIRKPVIEDYTPLGSSSSPASLDSPKHVISGTPSAATRGNVLEAINLASAQFSADYVDRDLVRTGVSIVVISPGAGLFEVDYNLLVATTDNLIDNGVGIDLVCLSQMPLHSVPLFKYKQPRSGVHEAGTNDYESSMPDRKNANPGSISSNVSYVTGSVSSSFDTTSQKNGAIVQWSHSIPHWVDVSFWKSPADEDRYGATKIRRSKENSNIGLLRHKPFIPRVRMYELQMMGVVESTVNDISIPPLRPTNPTARGGSNPESVSYNLSNSQKSSSTSLTIGSSGSDSARTPRLSSSSKSVHIGHQRTTDPRSQWMDAYDDKTFRDPTKATKSAGRPRRQRPQKGIHRRDNVPSSAISTTSRELLINRTQSPLGVNYSGKAIDGRRLTTNKVFKSGSLASISSHEQNPSQKANFTPRQISFGLRGLGVPTPKAVASTTLSVSHETPTSLLSLGLQSQASTTPKESPKFKPSLQKCLQDVDPVHSELTLSENSEMTQSSESESQSLPRPIPIRKATAIRVLNKADGKTVVRSPHGRSSGGIVNDRLATLMDTEIEEAVNSETHTKHGTQRLPQVLSPSSILAPWLTILNPSNPPKTDIALASRLGRWQHIFPRPIRNSQIKWKSLCSPAAIPLTTEEFPTADELAQEYEESSYIIALPEILELNEHSRSLVNEMLAFRLSRGFQIVVNDEIGEIMHKSGLRAPDVFSEKILSEVGGMIHILRGGTIHQMIRKSLGTVEIKQYLRHVVTSKVDSLPMLYKPAIRSTLADGYENQQISVTPPRGSFNWDMIDAFIVGHERPQAAQYVENLRPWRARFVLIPVDPPSGARRAVRSNEDNEEEIRLEGIRKLTQLWQRFRWVSPEERRFQPSTRLRKDPNPLDITYQTQDPSAIIAAELDSVLEGDETGRPVQLIPEPDLYSRSNVDIKSLAATIQGDKGVRMLDRRWHWRLHYNCFIGFELTTWILQNFRDVETRDEAVEVGKELMNKSLFQHVEQRHEFRDGNYFYQISTEYRAPRPESRGWFGRGKSSVPATPMSEEPPSELPETGPSRASSNTGTQPDKDASAPAEKQRKLSVALSKSLLYDVDHRKRSYRPELVNLHYDRLHNPDNCYHIRVEWMNTTPRLIQDTVLSWATSVDRFGLRLVEVPIGEASSGMHPFRAPCLVKLAQSPPMQQPRSYFAATAFAAQTKPDRRFYQKAIMKRFNFVLDYEAAVDFPVNVNVSYSWGKPDYRFPQYIHRSGVLVAQITDEGHFLLLANRLYNNRNAANTSIQEVAKADGTSESGPDRGAAFYRSSPHRGGGPNHRPSSRSSPFNSPSVRAALDIPLTPSTSTRGPSPTSSAPQPSGFTRSGATTAFATPEQITQDFQDFSANAETLDAFYTEVFSKASSPGPNTPFMGAKTPSKGPLTPLGESNIPSLALL